MVEFFWEPPLHAPQSRRGQGKAPEPNLAPKVRIPLLKALLHHAEGTPATLLIHVPKGRGENFQECGGRLGRLIYVPWDREMHSKEREGHLLPREMSPRSPQRYLREEESPRSMEGNPGARRDSQREEAESPREGRDSQREIHSSAGDPSQEEDSREGRDSQREEAAALENPPSSLEREIPHPSLGDTHLLFCGKVTDVTEKQDFLEIRLLAQGESLEEQWPVVAEKIKALGQHHEIWEEDPQQLLAAVPYGLYWDRCTGKLDLSHALKGEKTWKLHHQYDPKYRAVRKNTPLARIHVEISAQWVQNILGYANVAPQIARRFPRGVMGTLTDRAFESSWPEMGRVFPSGYFVSDSALRKIRDARYPEVMVLKAPKPQDPKAPAAPDLMARCSFYEGHLVLGYMYGQKRKETLTYTLQAALPPQEEGREESLALALPSVIKHQDLPLWNPRATYEVGDVIQHEGRVYRYKGEGQDLASHHRLRRHHGPESPPCWEELPEQSKWLLPAVSSAFFKETLGQEIFRHSLQCAKIALLWGNRCVHVRLRGTLRDWHALTLGDGLVLDPRSTSPEPTDQALQGKEGKIIEYTLHFQGLAQSAYVEITGAFSMPLDPAAGKKSLPPLKNPQDYQEGTWGDIPYAWPKKEPQGDGLCTAMKQGIVKGIHITHPLEEQLKCLEKIQEKLGQDQWDPTSLQSKETRIRMDLHTLRTQECLEHTLEVPLLGVFSGLSP